MRADILHLGYGQLAFWNHDGIARPYWRLYWNETPGWSIRWTGGSLALTTQRLVLIAPETVFAGSGPRPAQHLWIHATGDGVLHGAAPAVRDLPCDEVLRQLCLEIRTSRDEAQRRLHAVGLFLVAIARIAGRLDAAPRQSPAIAAAIALGERHLHRRVDNEEFARAACMQRSAFIRRFHADTGTTPQAWHQQRRINAACLALERGDEPIDDIAASLGFCDRHHFSRAFRSLRGTSPAAYRRTAQRS